MDRDALTDLGNAQRMAKMYRDTLRFVAETKTWHCWDETRWAAIPDFSVEGLAKKTVLQNYNLASWARNTEQATSIAKHAKSSEAYSRIKAMVGLLKSERDIPIHQNQLDANPFLLNLQNGTLDLKTGLFRAHNPHDLITKIANVAFDTSAKCPHWQDFISTIFEHDTQVIAYVQKLLGYCLTGVTDEQSLFLFIGNGAN